MTKRAPDRNNNNDNNNVFLFVNKTQKSKSLSKSDGAVAKQINRHAQHFRTRKIEAQRVTSALTSSSSARRIALDGWNRRDAPQSSSSDEASPNSTSPTDSSGPSTATPFPATPQTNESLLVDTPRSQQARRSSQKLPLHFILDNDRIDTFDGNHVASEPDQDHTLELVPQVYRANFTSYDCVDPFRSTPIRITPKIHVVLQYTLRIYPYSGNNYKLAFLPPHVRLAITQFPIGTVVQRSVFKEHHLYALMAAMTARMKHVFAVSPSGDDPNEIRALASRYLKEELTRCSQTGVIDKQTILDILYLVVSELQYNLYDDARKHLLIVDRLYHLLDLNQHLDRWISETAAHVDNQLALSTATRPILKSSFDPGPMLPERMATLRRTAQNLRHQTLPNPVNLIIPSGSKGSFGLNDAMADVASTLDVRMGSRFAIGLKAGAFPGQLGMIVSDLVDCIEIAKVVWLSPLAVCFDAEWLCRKARAVLRALLALAPENNIGPDSIGSRCTECARICLMILMTYACTLIGPQVVNLNVKRHLEAQSAALEHWCPAIGWTQECEPLVPGTRLHPAYELQAGFVLWSCLLACWTSEGLPEEQEWCTVRAVNIARYFGYSTYDDLHDHMAQYLYSRTMQESSMKKVAQRLQTATSRKSTISTSAGP
ncbi:uncharacterized protein PV06_03274 [Exophiala oligosperma]|uniref:Tachykinin family protein n=1 Tax=Exophiala oligosperma TaxID=215243 RepID=A0A0D2DQS7_9EURO|nr:uncharacterized protein PV06_03274 [Exophiala oligosperma]KIW44830.1 hypothetical protein PV06_03274 [Exophiala oligosperma]